MPKPLQVHALTAEEQMYIQQWRRSRTQAARIVERAQIIWLASQGHTVQQIADEMHIGAKRVRRWITRFNAAGLKGLDDQPRSGRPSRSCDEQTGIMVAMRVIPPTDYSTANRRSAEERASSPRATKKTRE